MSMKVRTLGQPEDTAAFLALLSAVADIETDSGFRAPRAIGDGRLYRYLTLRRPSRAATTGGLSGSVPVLRAILAERVAQLAKWGVQHRIDGTGDLYATEAAQAAKGRCEWQESNSAADWGTVLLEEVWEALAEEDPAELRAELVQVAAVAVAWIEDIDTRAARAGAGREAGA